MQPTLPGPDPSWRPRAVVFDCDGVLMDTERAWARVQHRVAEQVGVTIDERTEARLPPGSRMATITGEPGRGPMRAGIPFVDLTAGNLLALAVMTMLSPLLTLATLEFAAVILSEAALSFLGVGIQPVTDDIAAALGLPVTAVAHEQSIAGLLDALASLPHPEPAPPRERTGAITLPRVAGTSRSHA